ncbi:MAG: glyoxalase/bleomycin resistance/extradiol dioxygenase family protein [Phycisphaerae bacterium]|nr:glyoxalase/bleomycin resistance/extradiol dioxygenase family protein [Phycisphaerae bacterium]MBM91800.1 glyoxalase/bleomycin resistance/extradiol dioxygenase family protein [Phycisphaerae bacterium]|tara:strand:- start:908 stop:1312 length:405 start_codon:yes stop_codon:yes gene_type:complete
MKPNSILETILYANDLEQTDWFYHTVLGLDMPRPHSELASLFRISEHQVLLFFNPTISDKPGRDVPSHGARGPGHIALRIEPDMYDAWLKRFSEHGIAIEQEIEWSDRTDPGRSIYVRDPSGNSVELITADIWR